MDALHGLNSMKNSFPDSAESDDGQTHFLVAECYLKLGDYESAYENYSLVLKRAGEKEIINRSLNRIYHIGLFYIQGKAKRSFLGISYNSASYGVEILTGEDGLITKYPTLDYADDGLLEIGRYYFEKKQYLEAQQVFRRLVREYPNREWTELAMYQLGLTTFYQIRGVHYDQGPVKNAKRQFNLYRNRFPRGVHIEKVRSHLKKISEMEAQQHLTTTP